jgi:regulator of protease activity HflC (stomatin/prohibitin superfamily)
LPIADRIAQVVDTRIRATDFTAEKTLTRDTVPVHVDALTFWMIWDAKLAVLEVENFVEAAVLSAQTALRDAIGKATLAELLSERERIGREIQQLLDAKTNPWGITILSIEFTDIVIPQALEDAMSRRAQAERESQSRVILGAAEAEVATKYREAAAIYAGDEAAMHLRAMNMVYDGLKSNNSSIMVLPSSALDSMSLGGVMGAAALQRQQDSVASQQPTPSPAEDAAPGE